MTNSNKNSLFLTCIVLFLAPFFLYEENTNFNEPLFVGKNIVVSRLENVYCLQKPKTKVTIFIKNTVTTNFDQHTIISNSEIEVVYLNPPKNNNSLPISKIKKRQIFKPSLISKSKSNIFSNEFEKNESFLKSFVKFIVISIPSVKINKFFIDSYYNYNFLFKDHFCKIFEYFLNSKLFQKIKNSDYNIRPPPVC